MKFVKPKEISAKIMTLVDEADSYMLFISPYVKIGEWEKMLDSIHSLKKREVPHLFLVRDDKNESVKNFGTYKELEKHDFTYSKIEYLHSKIYLNEKQGLVTSMNLHEFSDKKSKDIAYLTETDEEHKTLKDYCKRYLGFDFNFTRIQNLKEVFDSQQIIEDVQVAKLEKDSSWVDPFMKTLSNKLRDNITADFEENDTLRIKTFSNNYYCKVDDRIFEMTGILSQKELDYAIDQEEKFVAQFRSFDELGLYDSEPGFYCTVRGYIELDVSESIYALAIKDKKIIKAAIENFIQYTEKLKKEIRENWKSNY